MIDAVFISDLHLHPDQKEIQTRFDHFLDWARHSVKRIYILGDFFHAWAGDDSLNEWSLGIAQQLHSLSLAGISLFYMTGNRDFLLGNEFANHAGWAVLTEPTIISLDEQQILLVHGDRYCTKDKTHQRFRTLTRNRIFSYCFLRLPLKYRELLVNQVRMRSQSQQSKSLDVMDVVDDAVIAHMTKQKVNVLIHGHTHKPGLNHHNLKDKKLKRYVLSDWDDNPALLCYYYTRGFCFTRI